LKSDIEDETEKIFKPSFDEDQSILGDDPLNSIISIEFTEQPKLTLTPRHTDLNFKNFTSPGTFFARKSGNLGNIEGKGDAKLRVRQLPLYIRRLIYMK